MPGTAEECFSLIQKAFDLAEQLQSLVIVLSDLDLGMNLHSSPVFRQKQKSLKRGKILNKESLATTDFERYRDTEGDGISYRVLPGTEDPKAAYFTRGSGHNERAEYSEEPEDYKNILNKLKTKWNTAKKMMPEPIVEFKENKDWAFVTFGNNEKAIREVRFLLEKEKIFTNFMRVRSFPFPDSVENFLQNHSKVFVVEQNRDGQLKKLLCGEFPKESPKMESILQYDGRPLSASHVKTQLKQILGESSE